MGWGRRGALFVLAALAVAAPHGSAVAQAAGESQGRVASSLTIDADRSGQLRIDSATTVRVPAGSPLAPRARLEATVDPATDFFSDSRPLLGSGLGLYELGRLFLDDVRVEEGTVIASAGLVDFEGVPLIGPFELALEDGLSVSTVAPRMTADVLLTLRLELDEVEVDSVEPAPTVATRSGSRTTLLWRFGPGEGKAISVVADPPWAVTFNLDLNREGWSGLRVLAWLVLVTALLPALLLLLGRRGGQFGADETASCLRMEVGWLGGAILLALLAAAATLIGDLAVVHFWFESFSWGATALAVLPLPFFAAFAGAIAVAARPTADCRRLAVACVAAAAALASVVFVGPSGPLEFELREALEYPAFAAALAAWALLVFLAVEGLIRIAFGWLRKGEDWERPVRVGSALLVVLLGWSAAAARGDVFDQAAIAIPESLRETLYAAAPLLPLVVLPAAFVLLAATRPRPLGGGRRGSLALLAVLFAFFAVTAVGAFVGFPSPFSLLLGALTLGALIWAGVRFPAAASALGRGPGADWAENARIALRIGAWLAIVPLAYVLVAVIRFDLGGVLDPTSGVELLSVAWLLGAELALWLVAALALGALFTRLPAPNGVLKGFLLSLPVFAGLGLMQLCPLYSGSPDWWFRCLEVLIFLSVLGFAMDLRTVRADGHGGRELATLYRSPRLAYGVAMLAPLLVAAVCVYGQARAGDPQDAVRNTLEAPPGQLPGSE